MNIFNNTKSDNRHPPYYFGRGNSSVSLCRKDRPLFPTFRRNIQSSSSRSRRNHAVRTLKLKAAGYFGKPGSSQTQGATTCFLDTQSVFQLIMSFSAVSFPVCKAANLPLHQPHLSLLCSFSFFCFTTDRKISCYYCRFTYI
jgi:hypothetical protein